jgi:hypothetical protein
MKNPGQQPREGYTLRDRYSHVSDNVTAGLEMKREESCI